MIGEHTSGPWDAIDRRSKGDHGFSIFSGNQYIAHVGDSDFRTPVEANAALIAAAPEMLDALVQLLEEAESLREVYSNARQFDGWDSIEEEPCFALARAAIAKATTLTPNAEVREFNSATLQCVHGLADGDLPMVGDLAMLVARLARKLRKAAPADGLPAQALDYLNRNGLKGSPLREVGAGETAVTRDMTNAAIDVMLKKGDVILSADFVARLYMAMDAARHNAEITGG